VVRDLEQERNKALVLEAFDGRAYIANLDLVERIRLDAPLNDQRPVERGCSPRRA
jgi:hypothetical protein